MKYKTEYKGRYQQYSIRTYINGNKEYRMAKTDFHTRRLHRVDGPAVEGIRGEPDYKGYYIHGTSLTKEQWLDHPLVKRHRLLKKIDELQCRI